MRSDAPHCHQKGKQCRRRDLGVVGADVGKNIVTIGCKAPAGMPSEWNHLLVFSNKHIANDTGRSEAGIGGSAWCG